MYPANYRLVGIIMFSSVIHTSTPDKMFPLAIV